MLPTMPIVAFIILLVLIVLLVWMTSIILIDLIAWVLLGIIAGSIAKFILPGKGSAGAGVTIALGIGGAFVGGFLGSYLPFLKSGASGSLSIGSIFTATVGALIILWIYRKMK